MPRFSGAEFDDPESMGTLDGDGGHRGSRGRPLREVATPPCLGTGAGAGGDHRTHGFEECLHRLLGRHHARVPRRYEPRGDQGDERGVA